MRHSRTLTNFLGASGLSLALVSPAALADIVGGAASFSTMAGPGVFTELVPTVFPAMTVGVGSVDDPGILYGFDEKTVLLASPLTVDFKVGGGSSIASGTTIQSHYIFFDPGVSQSVLGLVTFNFPILGLITSTAKLSSTDGTLGLPSSSGITYGSVPATGLEGGDSFAVFGTSLALGWSASSPGDHIRVITAVPEPGTYAMMAAGLALLGFMARRRMGGPRHG